MFRGSVSGLMGFEQSIRRLSTVPAKVAEKGAERIADLIDQQFASGTDAYGGAWAPHKESTVRRWGEHGILELTGATRGEVDVHPMGGSGIAIELGDLAALHQNGTSRMPARPILPRGAFPATWRDALEQAAAESFADATGGR